MPVCPRPAGRRVSRRRHIEGSVYLERWSAICDGGLAGKKIKVDGLRSTMTDALVRIEYDGGATEVARLKPDAPAFVAAGRQSAFDVATTYVRMGVDHILTGVDHLLFVLCLILLVQNIRKLLMTVTAFTVAHSMTLAAATLGFVHVAAAPVEATIALSIVFLASELLRDPTDRSDITQRYPWLVAFSFGLLHGLGFAGALAEIGLPQGEIPLALFAFNVGVEAGQLAFIAAVLSVGFLGRILVPRIPGWTRSATAYAIGGTASYWVLIRLAAG